MNKQPYPSNARSRLLFAAGSLDVNIQPHASNAGSILLAEPVRPHVKVMPMMAIIAACWCWRWCRGWCRSWC
eukprot:56706-Prorocentrum_lima.AAC.1